MKLTRRERLLIENALKLLNEAHPNYDGADYSQDTADTLAQKLQDTMATADLTGAVAFLNSAMKTNPEAMKEVLLGTDFVGDGDGQWSFDGTISGSSITGGTPIEIEKIRPTQATIDLQKSIGWFCSNPQSIEFNVSTKLAGGYSDGRNEPIAAMQADNDTYFVLDGHHRWSALGCAKGPTGKIAAAILTIPGSTGGNKEKGQEFLKACQVGIAADVMKTLPQKAQSMGLPYAKGGVVGSKDTNGGPFEILNGAEDAGILGAWPSLLGKVSHDGGRVLGGPQWWKKLCEVDPAGKFEWITGFDGGPNHAANMQKITQVMNDMTGLSYEEVGGPKPSEDGPEKEAWKEAEAAFNKEQTIESKLEQIRNEITEVWIAIGTAFDTNWNAVLAKAKTPNWAKNREIMPQFGGGKDDKENPQKASYKTKGGMAGMINRATKGDPVNYGKTYTRKSGQPQAATGQAGDASDLKESIDLQRWGKLAGLLKD